MDDPVVTAADIRRYADRARLALEPEAIEGHLADVRAQDELLAKLDDLGPPEAPSREHWDPDEETDPNAAFLSRCEIQRRENGMLAGQTVAIKDNIAVAGVPMTCGSPLMEEFVPRTDAMVVDRLLSAGATIVGKANMDEFALGGDPDAMRFRLAHNPHERGRMPGGSSAGSAVAVADGLADVALGTDTGGSVRFPASFCGIVGIKPSRGLVPHDGFVQFSKTLDTIGTLSQTVGDAAGALKMIAGSTAADAATSETNVGDYRAAAQTGRERGPSGIQFGRPAELFGHAPAVESVVDSGIDRLEDAGGVVTSVSVDNVEYAIPSWLGIGMTEMAAYVEANALNYWQPSEHSSHLTESLAAAFDGGTDELERFTEGNLLYGTHLMKTSKNRYYAKAQRGRRMVTDAVERLFADVDVLVSPTVPLVAPTWDDGYLEDNSLYDLVRTTGLFNLTGHPAITVPCGTVDSLPVGIQFVAAHGDDATAIRAAAAWEGLHK